jgi:hypothetical protein
MLWWIVICALIFSAGLAWADVAASGPVAWAELGDVNVEHALTVLNGMDGQNEAAVVGGSRCRRNIVESDPPSYCFYFDYDRAVGRPIHPAYVTVEYFDEGFGTFHIQYDAADIGASERGAYKDGATELLLDSRQWRKLLSSCPTPGSTAGRTWAPISA